MMFLLYSLINYPKKLHRSTIQSIKDKEIKKHIERLEAGEINQSEFDEEVKRTMLKWSI